MTNNPTMKGQSMLKEEERYAAVRAIVDQTPDITVLDAIKIVAKREKVLPDSVQSSYYRGKRKADGRPSYKKKRTPTATASRPTQDEILAKLQPIKTSTSGTITVGAASVKTNGHLREAALSALREYEQHIENREAAVEKREQQMDDLRAKIATLV